MTPLPHRRSYRTLFVLAGVYNLLWGLWTIIDPQGVADLYGIPVDGAPEVFAGMAMVIALYGFVYLEIARVPERGWVPAAVGLAGKVLGPAAVAWFVWSGKWPASTFWLTATNDFLWWVPFGLYLRDAWPGFREEIRPA